MKRYIRMTVFCLLVMVLLSLSAYGAEYTLEDLHLKVTIPDDWGVYMPGLPEDSPEMLRLAEILEDRMEGFIRVNRESNCYFNGVHKENAYNFCIFMVELPRTKNIQKWTEEQLEEQARQMANNLWEDEIGVEKYEIVDCGDYKCVRYHTRESGYPARRYMTVYNEQLIVFVFTRSKSVPFKPEELEEIEEIVNSLTVTKDMSLTIKCKRLIVDGILPFVFFYCIINILLKMVVNKVKEQEERDAVGGPWE